MLVTSLEIFVFDFFRISHIIGSLRRNERNDDAPGDIPASEFVLFFVFSRAPPAGGVRGKAVS